MLYAAAARTGKAMGYSRIQTYILQSETGVSLKAAGWICEGECGGGSWNNAKRIRRTDQTMEKKQKYALTLATNPPPEKVHIQQYEQEEGLGGLFT